MTQYLIMDFQRETATRKPYTNLTLLNYEYFVLNKRVTLQGKMQFSVGDLAFFISKLKTFKIRTELPEIVTRKILDFLCRVKVSLGFLSLEENLKCCI